MGVVADALDVLQGDLAVSVGYLLPTLYELRKSFEEFNQQNLKFCQPLNETLKEGFNKRFESFFYDESLVKAASFHPRLLFYFYFNFNYYNFKPKSIKYSYKYFFCIIIKCL